MDPFDAMSPRKVLEHVSTLLGCSQTSNEIATYLDNHDELKHLREPFLLPKVAELPPSDLTLVDGTKECIYFVGNSLGLQPKMAKKYIDEEGVHGHVQGSRPWAWAENNIEELMANVVGAKAEEVASMNGLTVHLHILLLSFYKPTAKCPKILLEDKAFPSDHVSNSNDTELVLNSTGCAEDILDTIEKEGDSIAVVLFSGVQCYTEQLFDMAAITKAGQKKGCYVGFDCAHAVGNAELKLHDWGSGLCLLYVNSGAGGLAGAFIHEKNTHTVKPLLTGWWGHNLKTRFRMDNEIDLLPGVSGFRLSNQPILLVCPRQASLEVTGTILKSRLLMGYLECLIQHYYNKDESQPYKPYVHIITPSHPEERGCQLSLSFSVPIAAVFQELEKRGVACDMREPNILRIAPVPLYNSFSDVHRFITVLGSALAASKELQQ
uniref:Kynureninase n=1 Tax=Salmo trutta TaxID=8032 RepID=A0A673ZLY2_SALTR